MFAWKFSIINNPPFLRLPVQRLQGVPSLTRARSERKTCPHRFGEITQLLPKEPGGLPHVRVRIGERPTHHSFSFRCVPYHDSLPLLQSLSQGGAQIDTISMLCSQEAEFDSYHAEAGSTTEKEARAGCSSTVKPQVGPSGHGQALGFRSNFGCRIGRRKRKRTPEMSDLCDPQCPLDPSWSHGSETLTIMDEEQPGEKPRKLQVPITSES